MLTYLDIDEHIKPFLDIGIQDTTQDKLLGLLNNMSAERLNSIFGVSTFAKHTVTDEEFENTRGLTIKTKDWPILSVTSIKQGENNTVYTQVKPYKFKKNEITLENYMEGSIGYDANHITYVAGFVTFAQNKSGDYEGQGVTFPDDLILANLLLFAGIYNMRKNMGVKSYSIQGKTVTFRDELEGEQFRSILKKYKGTFIAAI